MHRSLGLALAVALLALATVLSLAVGTRSIAPATVLEALTGFDPAKPEHVVVRELRVPRTILGLAVGSALGLAGVILQGLTRNALADPGIMGINAGAATFVVAGIPLLGSTTTVLTVLLGFAGAVTATIIVFVVASIGREGATPVKLALAGAAVTALFSSLTVAIVLTDLEALNQLRIWQVGSLAGRYAEVALVTVPVMAAGVIGALLSARSLDGLALGDDLAVTLGQRVRRTRALLFVTVAVLCGAAVAACGPIVFVGLVVPHLARAICGPAHRWVLPYAAVIGPALLLTADVIGRVALRPGELQVGVVLGVLGAPAFITLVRRRNPVAL